MGLKHYFQHGLFAWVLQRVTAIFLLLYLLPLLYVWLRAPATDVVHYWQMMLLNTPMRVLGALAFVSLVLHACVGSWVVITDYVQIEPYQRFLLVFFYAITVASSVFALGILSVA
jgi:succinate dehydrogenase hydrophobic membrane anchor protein